MIFLGWTLVPSFQAPPDATLPRAATYAQYDTVQYSRGNDRRKQDMLEGCSRVLSV